MNDKFKGLYAKYHIERINDPNGKHDDCFFFVLDINHDVYALIELKAYASACKKYYPQLSEDLSHAIATEEIKREQTG